MTLVILLALVSCINYCIADNVLNCDTTQCSNGTTHSYLIDILLQECQRLLVEDSFIWTIWLWLEEYQAWILSILGSSVVGLSGIFPLLVIPIEEGANLKTGAAANTLRVLLSFAVGGLLGDVFLHLLPEAWANASIIPPGGGRPRPSMTPGLWVLAGILLFTVLEMVCPDAEAAAEEEEAEVPSCNGAVTNGTNGTHHNGVANGHVTHNGLTTSHNGNHKLQEEKGSSKSDTRPYVPPAKQVAAGYLNLLANSIDNFMHGLAVGGGFLVSFKMGALTTLAILIHEVPHEIGDFAILLRAGFSRWDAARAQLYTAAAGLLGALTAVACSSSNVGSRTSWVVPFTAGGFLHIALVTVLPELLAERDKWESAKQVAGLVTGMCVMAVLTACFD